MTGLFASDLVSAASVSDLADGTAGLSGRLSAAVLIRCVGISVSRLHVILRETLGNPICSWSFLKGPSRERFQLRQLNLGDLQLHLLSDRDGRA